MKFGLLSAIFANYTFEQVIDYASRQGLRCVELACWPQGKAARRYAGVCHIDVDQLDKKRAAYYQEYCGNKEIEISSLGYYPNPLDSDLEKRQAYIGHIKKLIDAAAMLDINMITTFIGRDPHKTVSANLDQMQEVWGPILAYAEDRNVKVAIENCPMLFTEDEWPGGQNLMTTPALWKQVFDLLDSPALGLNYDPSHFVWQQMDYIRPIYEFKDKIFHVHFKDIKLYPEKLNEVGIMAAPLAYMSPKIPGLGDVRWDKFISALTDIRYAGCACVEIEDKSFEQSEGDIARAVDQSIRFLRQYI